MRYYEGMSKRTKPQRRLQPAAYQRPSALVILAALTLIAALVALGSGIALLLGMVAPLGGSLSALYGPLYVILGLGGLLAAWALWTLQSWAWWVSVLTMLGILILSALTLWLSGGASLGVVNLVLAVLVIYDLNTPGARRFFRRSQAS